MLIESKIRRKGGTKIELNGTVYHFKPGNDDRHVCEVADKDHIDRLLSIPEGYRLAHAAEPQHAPVKAADIKPAEPLAPADEPEPEAKQEETPTITDDRDQLVEMFVEKFGRKPHHKWSVERIQKELTAE